MAGERKFVWFNTETEKEEYEEAQSMQFSTEVKRWLRERIQRKNAFRKSTRSEITVSLDSATPCNDK